MKKYFSVFLVSTLALSVNAQEPEKDPYLVKSLSSDAIENIKCETSGGNISVEGASTRARIEVYIKAGNRKDGVISN
jgi:hypothetical protein